MNYRRSRASGLVCVLMVAGASRAGAADMTGGSLPQQSRICRTALTPVFYHTQGTMLWGTLPSWDPAVPTDVPTNVLRSIKVEQGVVTLQQADGQLSGQGLIGSFLSGMDSEGMLVQVVICGVDSYTDPGKNWTSIRAWNPLKQSWDNPCVATAEVPSPRALLLAGDWDSQGAFHTDDGKVTVACETGVLAKCVTWGYRPWVVSSKGTAALGPAHQACTRMARADYCGLGVSHTREGNLIDYYDFVGVAALDAAGSDSAGEVFEAAWGPDGAACVSTMRDGQPLTVLDEECPGRFQQWGSTLLQYGDKCVIATDPNALPTSATLRNRRMPLP